MSTPYWQMIADEITDMGWCCDYAPVETPKDGVLHSAYADKEMREWIKYIK